MAPITNCNEKRIGWTNAATKAFEEANKRITKAPVLHLLEFSKVFEMSCDASIVDSGVLSQTKSSGCLF